MKHSTCIQVLLLPAIFVSLCAGCAPTRFENEYGGYVTAADSGAAIPGGFRRTKDGWEDASLWHIAPQAEARSINEWVQHQQQREPHWVRKVLEKIRNTPPLMVAVIQIASIAAIVHIGRDAEAKSKAET